MGHHVAVAAYNGVLGYELGIVTEVFGLSRPSLEHLDYQLRLHRVEPGRIRTSHGLRIEPDGEIGQLTHAHTVIVPGWRDIHQTPPKPFLQALRTAHENGARIVGICSGAFPLAHAGLLTDQTATTHWLYASTFRLTFPDIDLNPDPLYIIGTNHTATSAGSTAGLDLCLALIAADHSTAAAAEIARRMVVTQHRPGTQAQFEPHDHPLAKAENPLADLLAWIEDNLRSDLTIERLADEANLSRRTLIRRFHQATGTSPHAWITRSRVHQAQALLETTTHTVDAIARRTGLGSAANLRKHLVAATGLTPSHYRRNHPRIRTPT